MKTKIIFTHGLWMASYAHAYWRAMARRQGFAAHSYGYPSVTATLDENTEALYRFVMQHGSVQEKVHLVGHSLGGILIIHALQRYPQLQNCTQHIVLCGSPVRGSYCAQRGVAWPVLGRVLGKSITQWRGLNAWQGMEHIRIGTIAGTKSVGLGRIIPGLPQPNDGTVAVRETILEGVADSLVMHVNHSELLFSRAVAQQIIYFLQNGAFMHRDNLH